MTTRTPNTTPTPEDLKMIEMVYQRRAKYIAWLTKALLFGAVCGGALGWATSEALNGFWLNPLTWLGLVWGGAIWATVPGNHIQSKARAVFMAPIVFKDELRRRTQEVRKDQALLVARFG